MDSEGGGQAQHFENFRMNDVQLIWEAYEELQQGKKALILIDIQNDFMPGGALAVNDGGAVIPIANQMML